MNHRPRTYTHPAPSRPPDPPMQTVLTENSLNRRRIDSSATQTTVPWGNDSVAAQSEAIPCIHFAVAGARSSLRYAEVSAASKWAGEIGRAAGGQGKTPPQLSRQQRAESHHLLPPSTAQPGHWQRLAGCYDGCLTTGSSGVVKSVYSSSSFFPANKRKRRSRIVATRPRAIE